MSGAMLGSRRIRCGWAQHKQETSSASYVAVDRVCTSVSVPVAFLSWVVSLQRIVAMLIVMCCPACRLTRRMRMSI